VSFHNFPLLEDRYLHILLKTLGKRMPETEIKKVEPLHLNVQAVMQLRSKRRDQDTERDRPLTKHIIVSVERGPEVAKVRSVTEKCGLRIQVETHIAPKRRCNANAASTPSTRSVAAATHPVAWLAETRTHQGRVPPQSSILNAAAAGSTTLPTIVDVVTATRRGRPEG
jgi:hypothetical protein